MGFVMCHWRKLYAFLSCRLKSEGMLCQIPLRSQRKAALAAVT